MILIGDQNIPFETISKINTIEDITNTKPNSTVLFEFDLEILKYTAKNEIQSAVAVQSIIQVIHAHNLGARYIIVSKALAVEVQDIADHYMFDSKILAVAENVYDIEELAKKHIDGIIYKELLG